MGKDKIQFYKLMGSNINLIAFGTFGNPNGFCQTFFAGNNELSNKIKTFDLNTNAIKLFPSSKLYAIRKENINGVISVSYCLYIYAKEHNSSRSGTFIGSSILYINQIPEEAISLRILNDFSQKLYDKNVLNDTITVIHSDDLSVSKPKDLDMSTRHLRQIEDINFNHFSNKYLVLYCELKFNNLNSLFSNSLDLLNVYDTIYFTDNIEIATFVHQKGIFRLVQTDDFEKEIADRQNEKKQNSENLLSEFINEKKKLEEDKRILIRDLKLQLESNERLHSENEIILKKSKDDIKNVEEYYSEFSEKIDHYLNQTRLGINIDHVRELYNENKHIFMQSISIAKGPIYIKEIKKTQIKSRLENQDPSLQPSNVAVITKSVIKDYIDRKNFNLYKILTVFFAFLWVLSSLYCLWIKNNDLQQNNKTNTQNTDNYFDTKNTDDFANLQNTNIYLQNEYSSDINPLKPLPNSQLNKNDLDLISKYNINGKTVDDIVDIIFLENPNDVKKYYVNQKNAYSKFLMKKNIDCFNENKCTKNNLMVIPSFKKP